MSKLIAWSLSRASRSCLGTWLPVLALLCIAPGGSAATFTASLDRDTITLGETATLSLTFSGAEPQNVPGPPEIPNVQVAYVGPSRQVTIVQGQVSSTVTHVFNVTPRQAGDYTFPSLTAEVGGQKLTSQPLTLKVLKPTAPPPQAINSGAQLAFVKLVLPKKEFYVGETVPVQLQLYLHSRVQRVAGFQLTDFPADGFNVGKMVEGQHSRTQVGNALYSVIPLFFPLKAVKAGHFTLGPAAATVVVEVPSASRSRDPWDMFGMFGGGAEQKQVPLASGSEMVQCLGLPREQVPPGFNGAIGSYSMNMTAGPTNVAAGDPITVKIQISGRGSLDAITLPEQPGWSDFKSYPPTVKLDTTDQFGLQGTKSFEQVVVPQSPDIKALPPVSFSFFDPEQKTYRTLRQPATPLVVRPVGSSPTPMTLAASRAGADSAPPAQDIVPLKQRLGAVAQIGVPLVQRPWFVVLQGVPFLALASAVIWRRRTDALANNPRLQRQRRVSQLIREGLERLRSLAAEKKSDEFFTTLAQLLQEQLGERLDLPSSAITEAVIDEQLRPRHVPDSTLQPLGELFQACNLARYAPVHSSQEMTALIPKLEALLPKLQEVKP